MTPDETTVLEAAKELARCVAAYNALLDRPDADCSAAAFIKAANAMEAAEDALVAATQPLLTDGP